MKTYPLLLAMLLTGFWASAQDLSLYEKKRIYAKRQHNALQATDA